MSNYEINLKAFKGWESPRGSGRTYRRCLVAVTNSLYGKRTCFILSHHRNREHILSTILNVCNTLHLEPSEILQYINFEVLDNPCKGYTVDSIFIDDSTGDEV